VSEASPAYVPNYNADQPNPAGCGSASAALGRFDELGIYVKGALGSGVTVEEIQEVLIQAIAYCGTPAGRQAFLAAHRTLAAEGALG
jgi:alkylhydroperoxidase/carboxymuconolactone decarboxylase family protein YurZ